MNVFFNVIFTARKRCLGKGNVFTGVNGGVCLWVQGRVSLGLAGYASGSEVCAHTLDTPLPDTPPRSTSRRYASYWNAFLFSYVITQPCKFWKYKHLIPNGFSWRNFTYVMTLRYRYDDPILAKRLALVLGVALVVGAVLFFLSSACWLWIFDSADEKKKRKYRKAQQRRLVRFAYIPHFYRVAIRTIKAGKMGRHFPVREKSGNY